MTEKILPPTHVRDMTPEQIREGLHKIRWGSKDGGLDKHARANGIRIKRY
jgi:hypothetical protein